MSLSTTTSRISMYLYSTLAGFLLSAGCWVFLFNFQMGSPTETSRYFFELHQLKSKVTAEKTGRKILVTGGSNVLFGIRAADIEKKLSIPAVNIGVSAGLGLEYILYQAQHIAHDNDVLVVALEYPLYRDSSQINEVLIDYVLARDTEYYYTLSWAERFDYLKSVDFFRVLQGIRGRISEPRKDFIYYRSSTLDENADETWNQESNQTSRMKKRVLRLQPFVPFEIGEKTKSIIRHFVAWCNKHQIVVFATYPATIYFDEYRAPAYISFFHSIAALWKGEGVHMLGDARDFMYPKESFFDTRSHLMQSAMIKRTKDLSALLSKEVLKMDDTLGAEEEGVYLGLGYSSGEPWGNKLSSSLP